MPYKDPDQQRAQARRWYANNRQRALSNVHQYTLSHLEEKHARDKKRRKEKGSQINAAKRLAHSLDPEKNRRSDRKRYATNPIPKRLSATKRYKADPFYANLCRRARDYSCLPELLLRVEFRDDYRCQHCTATEDLTFDHIYPVSKGGQTTFDNLQLLCRSCNSSKRDRT